MERYLIETPHTDENCLALIDVFRSGLFGQLSEFNHAAAPMASKS